MKSILLVSLAAASLMLSGCGHFGHYGCGDKSECKMSKSESCPKCAQKCKEMCGEKCTGDSCKMDEKSKVEETKK